MSERKGLVPELRFPEFEGEWNAERLGNGVELISGQHLSPNQYTTEPSDKPYFTGPSDFTNNPRALTKWALVEGKCAKSGDVLLTVKGNGVGELWLLSLPKVAMGRQLMAVHGKEFSARLVFQKLSKKRREFQALASGNLIPGLSRPDILKLKVVLPTLPEQKKIADFLGAVDDKIARLTEKKALLERYKNGMMQKLFSQSLRFKDENGQDYPDWEEKRLGSIVTFKKGKGITKADVSSDGKQLCIRYGELFTTYGARIGEVHSHTSHVPASPVLSEPNDVLMPTSDVTPKGLATASALDIEDVIIGGDILIVRTSELLNRFFAYYIQSNPRSILRLVSGVTVYHIYGADLASLILKVPHPDEQRKIADFLTAIDDKISQISDELAQAKQFKKGLLQQMFV